MSRLSPGTCFRHQPACEVSAGLGHYGPFDHPGQGQHNRALTASLPGSAQGRGKGNADLLSWASILYFTQLAIEIPKAVLSSVTFTTKAFCEA